jgi:hypothetical protein
MIRMECSRLYDLAPELALGLLDGAERAEVLAHLEQCATCHTDVASLTEIGEQLLLLGPEAQPPAGFENRVLDRLAPASTTPQPTIPPGAWAPALSARNGQRVVDPDDDRFVHPRPAAPLREVEAEVVPLRRRFPLRALAAAAALVAVVAGAAGLTLRLAGDQGTGGGPVLAAGDTVEVDMLTPTGHPVGSVALVGGEPDTIELDVAAWVEEVRHWAEPPAGPWALDVVDRTGTHERYELPEGDGTPEIDLDDGETGDAVASVALIDGDGRTWCTGTFE